MKKAVRIRQANTSSAVAQLDRAKQDGGQAQMFTAVNSDKRQVQVIIIKEGPGNSFDKHWYDVKAIRDGVKKFEGVRAFLNHQTAAEQEDRPEQDVRELCGYYKDTYFMPKVFNEKLGKMVSALGATFVPTPNEAGNKAFGLAKAQVIWSQTFPEKKDDCFAALSINSGGFADGEIEYEGEEWTKVTEFNDVASVDVVTRPGAGGAFLSLTESTSGAPDKNKEGTMLNKKVKTALKSLESAVAAVKANKDEDKLKALEATRDKAQKELLAVMREAEKKEKDDKEEAADDGDGDDDSKEADDKEEEDEDGDPMDAMRAHVPKIDGENDQQYNDRMNAVMSHAGRASASAAKAAKGQESEEDEAEEADDKAEKKEKGMKQSDGRREAPRYRESSSVRDFRKSNPKLFNEIMESNRAVLGLERGDIKTLKTLVESQTRELNSMRLDLDLRVIESELDKAGIPKKYLSAARLLRMDESARKEEIERTLLIMEGAGAARIFGGSSTRSRESAGNGDGFTDYAMLGVPDEKAAEDEE